MEKIGGVAQLGERSVRIREVEGSNPFVSTNVCQTCYYVSLAYILSAVSLGMRTVWWIFVSIAEIVYLCAGLKLCDG